MKNKDKKQDYIKANKRAERELRLENQSGFVANTHVHKSKKVYSRKNYHVQIDY